MTMKHACLSAALLAGLFVLSGPIPALAEDCTLKQAATLDLDIASDGTLVVPVTISGNTYRFALGMNYALSAVSSELVQSLNLPTKKLPAGVGVTIGGAKVPGLAVLPDLHIGAVHGKNITVLEMPPGLKGDSDGRLGIDLLSSFDVELNLGAGKLNLFSPKHCEGKVVYWGAAYSVIPFKTDVVNFPYFEATLDGKSVTVSLSANIDAGRLGSADASELFHILPSDSRLVPLVKPGEQDRHFSYPFKTLMLGGITITNPRIVLYSQKPSEQCHGDPEGLNNVGPHSGDVYSSKGCYGTALITLGRSELRALHLYFAFKEKKLYVSAADPVPAPPPASPAANTH